MINEDNRFQMYANDLVKDVPDEWFKYLIALFMKEAAINMGCEVSDEAIERSIYYVKTSYAHIPITFIASAFIAGSLGRIGDGKGRLIPKTIITWLSSTSLEYTRATTSKQQRENNNGASVAAELDKYPLGSAIVKKMEWYRKGLMSMRDWDRVPLKELAEKIKSGVHVTPGTFGL